MILNSTNGMLRATDSLVKPNIKGNCLPVFVRKHSNRKNKLITNSYRRIDISDNFGDPSDIKEVQEIKDMKRYLSKQHRVQDTHMSFRNRKN